MLNLPKLAGMQKQSSLDQPSFFYKPSFLCLEEAVMYGRLQEIVGPSWLFDTNPLLQGGRFPVDMIEVFCFDCG